MIKNTVIAVMLSVLTACGTVAGMGRDIRSAGAFITGGSEDDTRQQVNPQ